MTVSTIHEKRRAFHRVDQHRLVDYSRGPGTGSTELIRFLQ